ncbi:hypothetical protein SAMN04487819_109194 [Actinopolyspora alba]|uniref:ParB/Sulfiredoxin domain-containing protein n=1 Tax=Actinopolyspora alba TaxID=673379 RepID=A0A1I1YVL3_9ACTN|nr:hypothetical protein [Actinopolyspora alba]SFE22070.1 hypothetical protein SAMN04487819_109194 [Actinopolyspora alba]
MAKASSKQPMRPPFPVESVPLELIDLDLRNSRFARDAQSQTDAFELMITTAGDDCLDLLRDLTRTGQMNSSDLPIVVTRDGRYIMMEGNRRLTCLRLWSDTELLNRTESLEKQFFSRAQRMVDDSAYSPPAELRVAVAPSEADADVWVERKHTGGAGGAGTVEWDAAMKDRRRARNDPTKASRAMAFVDLVSREYEDERDIQIALETVRSKRYTMIQRFVDRSVVRKMLGLDFSEGKMTFEYGPRSTMPIVRQVLNDFARPKAESGKTWARELDTVDDFKNYLNRYTELLPSNESEPHTPDKNDDQRTSENSPGSPHADSTPSKQGDRVDLKENTLEGIESEDERPPRPTPAREYIFRGLVLDKFTRRIQDIVRQTSLLNVKRQNDIVAVMLRVILEMTTYQFLMSRGRDVPRNLERSLKEAIKVIEPNASDALGAAEETSPLRKAFHSTTADSVRLTHYAVHDIHSGRTPSEVLTLADRYAPLLEEMNANMGSTPIQ